MINKLVLTPNYLAHVDILYSHKIEKDVIFNFTCQSENNSAVLLSVCGV